MLNTPMDVVKTRIQGYTGNGPKKYNWTLPSVALVAKEEGYKKILFLFLIILGRFLGFLWGNVIFICEKKYFYL